MTDRGCMEQALALAALGEGTTSPNPLVGCVVLREGLVVGAGFHRAAGEAHAEATALASAGELARGATLVVNLEPCAHHGKTPPCVDAILGAGIARVVLAHRDPNPLVNGRGIERLLRGGVDVAAGTMESEARRLNAPFLSWHIRGRPFVTLKAALTWDGQIAAAGGSSTWVSGEASRRFAHRLRFTHDAVLVGAETVRRDDPRLTVRLPGLRARRIRVVLAPRLDIDPHARIFTSEDGSAPRPRIYASERTPLRGEDALARVAEIIRVPEGPEGLALDAVLRDLAAAGVQSLLVEGGGRTHGAFLGAGLADEITLLVAPRLFGAVGSTAAFALAAPESPDRAWRLEGVRTIPLGGDRLVIGRPVR